MAAVLVLRPARPLVAVAAFHGFLVLRIIAVCDVLWPRLDRDRAPYRAAHRPAVRTGARQPRVRLDLRRPPVGRGRIGVRRRPVTNRARNLSAGVFCRGRAVHRPRVDHADDIAVSEADLPLNASAGWRCATPILTMRTGVRAGSSYSSPARVSGEGLRAARTRIAASGLCADR